MIANEAEHGTCIVMEVATGKIKAVANLGRQTDGSYWEDLNYAIRATEPGSTFKLATLLSLLEDHKVHLTDNLNLEGGVWKVAGRTVYDSEPHDNNRTFTVKEAFEISSNVGMAKLAWTNYSGNPGAFVDHLKKLRLNEPTGVDLVGETTPIVKNPKSRTWSNTTLPWMAFGYEVLVSPLQTLTLYNAVANNGRMMKPYLVSSVQESGITIKENEPKALVEKICSDATLQQLKECLRGVVSEKEGTARKIFATAWYKVAGKTGTALVANGSRGYADHIYQSSFAGYFPADNPKYSCIVVIKNKPFAKNYLGALVAGPVFRELADKLMSAEVGPAEVAGNNFKKDSAQFFYAGSTRDMREVVRTLGVNYIDSTGKNEWARLYASNYQAVMNRQSVSRQTMPDVKGMGLKDALYLLESADLKVAVKGRGKVKMQSIIPGSLLKKNETVSIELN